MIQCDYNLVTQLTQTIMSFYILRRVGDRLSKLKNKTRTLTPPRVLDPHAIQFVWRAASLSLSLGVKALLQV